MVFAVCFLSLSIKTTGLTLRTYRVTDRSLLDTGSGGKSVCFVFKMWCIQRLLSNICTEFGSEFDGLRFRRKMNRLLCFLTILCGCQTLSLARRVSDTQYIFSGPEFMLCAL